MAWKIAVAILIGGVIAAGLVAVTSTKQTPDKTYATLASVKPVGLAKADPRLQKIYAQASALLGGGYAAYSQRLQSLRGLPVVVNKWGSWCPPCRAEFPAFQAAGKKYGAEVAFLGANVSDSDSAASKFLTQFPVPYPSYVDDKLKIAAQLKPAGGAPVTGFYDAAGHLFHTHAGPYRTAAALEADVRKYALAAGPSEMSP